MKLRPDIKIKIIVITVAVTTAVFAFSGVVYSQNADTNLRSNLENRLQELKKQINNYQSQIDTTRKQQASLKNEIGLYDNQISLLELQIQANETQTEDTNLQIKEIENQITRRKAEIEDNKKILAQLIVQLSQFDDTSFLNIGLGNDNFSAFLDQIQYTKSVQSQVYSLVQKIKEIKTKLEQQQSELEAQLKKLEELRQELNETQSDLETQRQNKETLLTQTRGVEKNYQKLLTQSETEQSKIEQEISELDEAARSGGNKSISPSKGVLAWPMKGVLTQGYGNTGFKALGYSFHSGIDIAAPAGAPIYAAADGVVNGIGTNEAVAYGNWITIKHSIQTKSGARQVVTLYAHLRSFKVTNGQQVKQGDLIGYEGNTGNTTRLLYGNHRGYHVHFMVIDADGFKITKGKYSNVYGTYSVPSGYTYNPLDFLGSKP